MLSEKQAQIGTGNGCPDPQKERLTAAFGSSASTDNKENPMSSSLHHKSAKKAATVGDENMSVTSPFCSEQLGPMPLKKAHFESAALGSIAASASADRPK